MAVATTLREVYNFNEPSDRAIYAALARVGITPTLPRDTKDLEDIDVIPNLQLGPASGHLFKTPGGDYEYDLFQDCVLEIDLATPRRNEATFEEIAGVYSLYARLCADIRIAVSVAQLAWINAQMPFHHITRLKPLGTQQGFSAATGDDRATIRYGCWVGMKPDAWPTDPAAYTSPFTP